MQDITEKIIEIITANFPNGIRDDFIDTNKILRIYSANHADKNISRDFIADVIRTNGIENGGRFYFTSNDNAEDIKRFIDEILSAHAIAYYCAVHEKHADFFAAMHVFSPDVLKKILQTVVGGHFYFEEFCAAKRTTRLDYEISKIFMATEMPLSLDDLQSKLPYVPAEKISAVLSNAKKFLPTIEGKFCSVSKIQFDIDEIDAAKQQIISAINANGYAAPDDYNLASNFAFNPDLAERILRNAIYEKFFSDEFIKRGKRLFKSKYRRRRKF